LKCTFEETKKEEKEKEKGQFDDVPMIVIVDGKRRSGRWKKNNIIPCPYV